MCLPGFGTKATHKNRAAHRGRGRFRRACGLLSLWQAVCYPVYRMQCVPECALFLPYSSQTIGNGCTRTRIETTMILYKVKQTQTVIFQLAHSFNQRVMDSSSLERTKIPRRIARFLVGFFVFWGSAHFCTPAGKPCFSLHCLHSVHRERNLSGRRPSILLRKTAPSLKSPTGAFIAPLRCANANFALQIAVLTFHCFLALRSRKHFC